MSNYKYRIVECERQNGDVFYRLDTDGGTDGADWKSVFSNEDLEKVRELRTEREHKQLRMVKAEKVIE